MPILDAVERLLTNDPRQAHEPVYNIQTPAVVYQAGGIVRSVMPVRDRIIIPMTQFHYNHEVRSAIVSCLLDRAQQVMHQQCPAIYLSRDPMEIQAHAEQVYAQEGLTLGAVLLNPAHLDFVNEQGFPCYVHSDAPIGAVIFLPVPEELGVLVSDPAAVLVRGMAIFGMPVTVLTEPGDPAWLPDQETRLGDWLETLEQKPPAEPEPVPKDVWERLGEEDDLF
jgi:hypothetical protein